MSDEANEAEWRRRYAEVSEERDTALATVDAYVERIQVQQKHLDEARKLLRVALGLLSVASFQTDFEGRRCFDLERQIRTILPSAEVIGS